MARSKVTPSPHAHLSSQVFFLWALVNKVRIIFGSSEFMSASFIELQYPHYSSTDNLMFCERGIS